MNVTAIAARNAARNAQMQREFMAQQVAKAQRKDAAQREQLRRIEQQRMEEFNRKKQADERARKEQERVKMQVMHRVQIAKQQQAMKAQAIKQRTFSYLPAKKLATQHQQKVRVKQRNDYDQTTTTSTKTVQTEKRVWQHHSKVAQGTKVRAKTNIESTRSSKLRQLEPKRSRSQTFNKDQKINTIKKGGGGGSEVDLLDKIAKKALTQSKNQSETATSTAKAVHPASSDQSRSDRLLTAIRKKNLNLSKAPLEEHSPSRPEKRIERQESDAPSEIKRRRSSRLAAKADAVASQSFEAEVLQNSRNHLLESRNSDRASEVGRRSSNRLAAQKEQVISRSLPPKKGDDDAGPPPFRGHSPNVASSVNEAVRLKVQLTLQDKKYGLLDGEGYLTDLAKSTARDLHIDLRNPKLKNLFGDEFHNWSKYTTTVEVPFKQQTLYIHFYMHKITGEVKYPFDYKVKPNGTSPFQKKSTKGLRKIDKEKVEDDQKKLFEQSTPDFVKSKEEGVDGCVIS